MVGGTWKASEGGPLGGRIQAELNDWRSQQRGVPGQERSRKRTQIGKGPTMAIMPQWVSGIKRSQPDKGIMIRGRVVRDKRRICVSSQLGANSKHSFLISWPCCNFTAQSMTSFAAKGVNKTTFILFFSGTNFGKMFKFPIFQSRKLGVKDV